MTRYDPAYLASLSRDMAKGDSDACAGFFAATYKEAIATASKRLGDEYAVQDVIEKLYTDMFQHNTPARSGRVLLISFRNKLNALCSAAEGHIDRKRIRIPLRQGYGVNNEDSAELLLHYIFRRLGREPSHLPLSAFVAYNEYRISRFTLQYTLIAAALVILLSIPLVFSAPKLTLEADDESSWAPTYTLVCDSFLPADSVSAKINGNSIPVTLQQDGSYIIAPTEAGILEVKVTLVTKVSASIEATVVQVDLEHPTVLSSTADSAHLTVTLSDTGSGLDLENAYALSPDGSKILPESWDNANGIVVFPRLENNSNIYFPDIAGNVLHVVCQYET